MERWLFPTQWGSTAACGGDGAAPEGPGLVCVRLRIDNPHHSDRLPLSDDRRRPGVLTLVQRSRPGELHATAVDAVADWHVDLNRGGADRVRRDGASDVRQYVVEKGPAADEPRHRRNVHRTLVRDLRSRQQRLARRRQRGEADVGVGLVRGVDADRSRPDPLAELLHAERGAGADRAFQLDVASKDGVPDRDAIVDVADIPQVIGAVLSEPGRDDVDVVRPRVVLDDVDHVDAVRLGELLLPATDRAAIYVVDSDNHGPG